MNLNDNPPLAGATGSVVPMTAGFYWWRQNALHIWRMVHIQNHAEGLRKEPYLVAYDVSFSSFFGRDLKSWKEFFDVGEWVRVDPPNSGMNDAQSQYPVGSTQPKAGESQ